MDTSKLTAKQKAFCEDKFYTYALIDPRNNKVFYIGKGYKDRIKHHVRDVKRGKKSNLEKTNVIKSILSENLEVKEKILKYFDFQEDALEYEEKLINKIGFNNLTNQVRKSGLNHIGKRNKEISSKSFFEEILRLMHNAKCKGTKNDNMATRVMEELIKIFNIYYSKISEDCRNVAYEKYSKSSIRLFNVG